MKRTTMLPLFWPQQALNVWAGKAESVRYVKGHNVVADIFLNTMTFFWVMDYQKRKKIENVDMKKIQKVDINHTGLIVWPHIQF